MEYFEKIMVLKGTDPGEIWAKDILIYYFYFSYGKKTAQKTAQNFPKFLLIFGIPTTHFHHCLTILFGHLEFLSLQECQCENQ